MNQVPLHYAAERGFVDVVERLLYQGSTTINQIDNNHRTPLHLALLHGHERVVSLLLQYSPSLEIVDYFGYRSLELAAQKGMKDIVSKILLCHLDDQYTSPKRPEPPVRNKKTFENKPDEMSDLFPSLLYSNPTRRLCRPISKKGFSTFIAKFQKKLSNTPPRFRISKKSYEWKDALLSKVVSVLHCVIDSRKWEIFQTLIFQGFNPNIHQGNRSVLQYALDHSIPLEV